MPLFGRTDAIDRAYLHLVALAAVAVAVTVFGTAGAATVAVVALVAAMKARFVVFDFLERRRRRGVLTVALLTWPVAFLLGGAVVAMVAAHR